MVPVFPQFRQHDRSEPGRHHGQFGVQAGRGRRLATGVIDCPDDAIIGAIGRNRRCGAALVVIRIGSFHRRRVKQGIGNGVGADPGVRVNQVERIFEEGRRHITIAARAAIKLLHYEIVPCRTVEASHVVAVHHINRRCLASPDDEMRVRRAADRIGQDDGRTGAEVLVPAAQGNGVRGCEIVNQSQAIGGGKLHQAHGIVAGSGKRRAAIERAVARLEIQVALRIHGGAAATIPEAALRAVGRGVKHADLLGHVRGVVTKEPAMIRLIVAVRGKRHINHPIQQCQRRPAVFAQRIPQHVTGRLAVIIAGAGPDIIGA